MTTTHEPVTAPTIVIGCGATKLTYPAPARLLYTGSLFRMARAAAEADGRPWVILSALHGFLHPHDLVAPYDHTVKTDTDHAQLVAAIDATRDKVVGPVEAWCPDRYVSAIRAANIDVAAQPLRSLGIGHQRAWFASHARQGVPDLFAPPAP